MRDSWVGVFVLREALDTRVVILRRSRGRIVQINAGAEMLDGEEFGDDNFDFDEDAEAVDDADAI